MKKSQKYGVVCACLLSIAVAPASAALMTYEGSFVVDNTSSIVGVSKDDSFFFSLTLDGSSVDLDHGFDDKPDGATEFFGRYVGAVVDFQMTAGFFNSGDWDPSGLTYDFVGSTLLTWDVNPPADDDPLNFMNEHLFVSIGVDTAGSPVELINFNLYNSTFYEPNATRQLWLDASTPTNGFTLDDLFLHGMDTLSEFKSIKPPVSAALVDSVWLDGPDGTVGSGTLQSLAAVPVPATVWLFGSGLIGLIGVARRKKS